MNKITSKVSISGLFTIPLSIGRTLESQCVVKVGDNIRAGELIGKSNSPNQLNIYSSVSGRVVAIDKMVNTRNGLTNSVLIQIDKEQVLCNPLNFEETTIENFKENIRTLGLVDYMGFSLYDALRGIDFKKVDYLGVVVFDEYKDINIQCELSTNAPKLMKAINFMADILGVNNIKFFLENKNSYNGIIKFNILKNAKKSQNIEFFELKMPKNANFYDFFEKKYKNKFNSNALMQTPETFIDIFEGLKNKKLKLSRRVYIGGSATNLNDGYIEVLNGVSLRQVMQMCGGLVFEEQDIIDAKSDIGDDIEKMLDAKKKFQEETDRDKKTEFKKEYKEIKSKTNSIIWEFLKKQRINLMKTIRQIRIGSKKSGQIFTDFSPILDFSDNAIYFLNRKEC